MRNTLERVGHAAKRAPILLVPLLLAACGGGGGDSGQPGPAACASLNTGRSHIDSSCVGCSIPNPGDVADGSLFSFADVNPSDSNFTASIRAGNGGTVLPAGTRAGAFVLQDVHQSGLSSNSLALRTYLAGALAESAAVPDVQFTRGGTDAEFFISFVTTAPFDAVEIVATFTDADQLGSADLRVYELCSDGHI